MVASDVSRLEDAIRVTCQTRRVRPSQFFMDYDRLRSGFVTDSQFARVLWENLSLKLSEGEAEALSRKYDIKGDGRLNYRYFCDVIDEPFDARDLSKNPIVQKREALELLGTKRTVVPVDDDEEVHLEDMLRNLYKYYKYRGLNLRTSCEDFDTHHLGVINESQFYRSFPRPPEITEKDVEIIVRKYRDPDRPGLMNYLNLHHDLLALGERDPPSKPFPTNIRLSDYLPPVPGADPSVQEILDHIRVAVHKQQVRTLEYFKDYDSLRCGAITENQFVCGLSLAIGKEAQLNRAEIQKVAEYYKQPDSRILYREFCDSMENAFNIPHLEKKPTLDVVRPPQGSLGRNLPELSGAEEERVSCLIRQLSDQVRKRRLMVYQYFKDYDRSNAYSRVITPTQFGRILHFLSLNVAPEELRLLCRKFADNDAGDINYPAFVQTIDQEFVNYTQAQHREPGVVRPPSGKSPAETCASEEVSTMTQPADISLDDLMARIRHLVLTNRLRVCEFFQDFDPLRCGAITKTQFRRGLSDLGLSTLGLHNLSLNQFGLLCDVYEHPTMKDKALWRKFTDDVESVFTQQGDLEKMPGHKVPPHEIFRVPKPGTMNWDFATEEHKQFEEDIMKRLRARADQRRLNAKPVFKDFDKSNNGYVTRSKFRRCLSMLDLNCTEDELQALEARFCNDSGFNYTAFLERLQPEEKSKMMYIERLYNLRKLNEVKELPERDPAKDLEGVLNKVKSKVFKERMRILEWMRDYDKLRSGKMPRTQFRRALDLCNFELQESELAILEDHYQSPVEPDHVRYLKFCEDIEGIFAIKNLEKAPLLPTDQYVPPVECIINTLEPDNEERVNKCLDRLANQVRLNRIQLFPLFEDYDRVHNGTVSRSQFRRVLNELELACHVPTELEWLCLWRKFEVKVGGRADVHYVSFCDKIYEMAKFEWRKP